MLLRRLPVDTFPLRCSWTRPIRQFSSCPVPRSSTTQVVDASLPVASKKRWTIDEKILLLDLIQSRQQLGGPANISQISRQIGRLPTSSFSQLTAMHVKYGNEARTGEQFWADSNAVARMMKVLNAQREGPPRRERNVKVTRAETLEWIDAVLDYRRTAGTASTSPIPWKEIASSQDMYTRRFWMRLRTVCDGYRAATNTPLDRNQVFASVDELMKLRTFYERDDQSCVRSTALDEQWKLLDAVEPFLRTGDTKLPWDLIAVTFGVLPDTARHRWRKICMDIVGSSAYTSQIPLEEFVQKAREHLMKPKRSPWKPTETLRLLDLVETYCKEDRSIDVDQISRTIGRTPVACALHLRALQYRLAPRSISDAAFSTAAFDHWKEEDFVKFQSFLEEDTRLRSVSLALDYHHHYHHHHRHYHNYRHHCHHHAQKSHRWSREDAETFIMRNWKLLSMDHKGFAGLVSPTGISSGQSQRYLFRVKRAIRDAGIDQTIFTESSPNSEHLNEVLKHVGTWKVRFQTRDTEHREPL